MTLAVRPETGADAEAIRTIHLAAFPTSAEADLVGRLREDREAEISLVAEQAGEMVGHIVMSRMRVTSGSDAVRALGLGPVAVLPGAQGSGIGSKLIRSAHAIAETLGEGAVFVLGDPDYYRRFGFSAEAAAPFASPYSGPYFMALWLRPSAGARDAGRADYAPAFARLSDPQ